jgi:hypothetical protein
MPTKADISNKIVDNTFKRDNSLRATYNTHSSAPQFNLPPVFQRWVVLEVIFDPYFFNQKKLFDLELMYGEIKNANQHSISSPPPRNSIIAKPVYDSSLSNRTESEMAMILYPMFPSTISMPCKPGEHVWVMFESLTQKQDLGYWVCSIVGPGHVEDVNHSHHPRSLDNSFYTKTNAKIEHNKEDLKPRYHFKNGQFKTVLLNEEEGISTSKVYDPATATLYLDPDYPGDESAYEKLLTETDAAKVSVYESIPRFKKRPGDLALEGSNNSLIVLGRDRTGPVVKYTIDEDGNAKINTEDFKLSRKNAGSIDIVAGRGQTIETGGEKAFNDLQHQELAKHRDAIRQNEGDPDFINDRSRIYVSQNTFTDFNLGRNFVGKNMSRTPPVQDSEDGDSGIIIKSDKVRIFARSDVQILVSGFTEEKKDSVEKIPIPEGLQELGTAKEDTVTFPNNIKNENKDSKSWASITIKSNGDIVFEPSEFGYIKLGGEDANKGILCTSRPVITSNGGIAGFSILTTAGGQICGSSSPTPTGNQPALPQKPGLDLGTFSNKVLIK